MFRKSLLYCGIAAPILYVITVLVGAAVRNDYSHMVNAISELISNGAPNKAILDVIFNIYGALLLAFAIGGYIVLKNSQRFCRIAMGIFIGIQILSFSWGFFPMDPLGSETTFAGSMHNVLGGVVALATILMPLLMGLGLRRSDDFHGYAIYSFISSAIIFISGLTGVILGGQGFLVFGFFERITIGTYEIWIFVTTLNMLKMMQEEVSREHVLSTQADLDFTTQAPKLDVPVYLFAGRDDVNAMSSIVEGYYNILEAPHKELTWLNGGHGLDDGNVGQFVDVVVNKVKAETYPHQ
jgi:hypothetical protein